MQKRHKDRQCYFNELANTSRSFYIDYVKQFISLSPSTHILEIGCGEGGNLLPFAELGCKVTGIDRAASRIHQAETFFTASGYKGEFTTTDFFNFSSASRYQLILIHDVIEHISNKEEFFRCLTSHIKSAQDFLYSSDGMFTLSGICMQLIFIGESVKVLDAKTEHDYLLKYPME